MQKETPVIRFLEQGQVCRDQEAGSPFGGDAGLESEAEVSSAVTLTRS